MTLNAKTIIKNKFWIVERDGEKIATIQAGPGGVFYVDGNRRTRFPSIKVLSQEFGVKFDRPAKKIKTEPSGTVYGFPIDTVEGFNALYNVVKRVPVYTKCEKSKSMFCAGYYLIELDGEWTEAFCPKLITINRYPFVGPFYSEEEMKQRRQELNV